MHRQLENTVGSDKSARKYSLEELIAEMPDELPRVEGWDEMPSVGRELSRD